MNTSSKVKITETVPLFDVADVERSIAFYVDGLGFELQNKWVDDDILKWCRVQHGDSALMLQKTQGEPPSNRGPGLTLYFICEDAITAHEEFKERGVPVGEPFVGNNMDVFYFKDPDGYRLSFESPIRE